MNGVKQICLRMLLPLAAKISTLAKMNCRTFNQQVSYMCSTHPDLKELLKEKK